MGIPNLEIFHMVAQEPYELMLIHRMAMRICSLWLPRTAEGVHTAARSLGRGIS